MQELGVARIRLADSGGRTLGDAGSSVATAVAERELVDPRGRRYRLEISDRTAPAYARSVQRITGLHVVVRSADQTLGATLDGVPSEPLPLPVGEVEVGDTEYRVASFADRGAFGEGTTRVSLFDGQEETDEAIGQARLLAAALLGGFFILAFTFAAVVSRSLQSPDRGVPRGGPPARARRLLVRGPDRGHTTSSRRSASSSTTWPASSRAGSRSSGEQRRRLENQLRRIGEAFASNLDRDALLEIAVRTTVDGVGGRRRAGDAAARDRACARGARRHRRARRAGGGRRAGRGARCSRAASRARSRRKPAARSATRCAARATRCEGVVSVWRRERPFAPSERELFHYLAAQAGVSIENVELHETVQRQAVTDELTGLSNHRRFQEALASELERARRFETGVGLVMLDVDNFKQVNDTYGHQIGDRVLQEVARVLRTESREVDEPARYGGEELAVVLPGADIEGAYNLAERVRSGIEAIRIPVPGDVEPLRVTASFGAAALPESAHDQGTLIAAADVALYAAKRAGKNRTIRAEPQGARPSG